MILLFFVLWIIFNGKITLEILLFGVVITAAVTLFAQKVVGYPLEEELRIFRNLPFFLLYVLILIKEIIKSAVAVTTLVYEAEDPDPVIIEFHSGFQTKLQNVLLANSITLTPGTITVFQDDDHFVVHCLRKEYAEGIEDSSFVKILGRFK